MKTQPGSYITACYLVPGLPHPLLAPDANPAYKKLRQGFEKVRDEISSSDAEVILYFSTQWLTVLGYLFQADPEPKWTLADPNFHDLGSMPYQFKVEAGFAKVFSSEVKKLGHYTREVNYRGFPIDTGTVVAQMLLNPKNRIPAAMASCNMYAEKQETLSIGQAAMRAIEGYKKRTVVVLVSGLSSRFHTDDIPMAQDKISSLKDDEWNRKILELLGEGRLEDVSEVAREVARQANGDMGFRGFWWLNGLCGKSNAFKGQIFEYQPIYGTGAAIAGLYPTHGLHPVKGWSNDEADLVERFGLNRGTGPESEEEPVSESSYKAETEPMTRAQTTSSVSVSVDKAPPPVGPYPHARIESEMIFLSGVGPRKPGQKEIPGVKLDEKGHIISYDVEVQTRSMMENIKAILEACNSSFDEVIDVQAYLTNMKADFPTFNKIYGEYFGKYGIDKAPTRTTIEVGALPTPIAVEMKVIAKRYAVPFCDRSR